MAKFSQQFLANLGRPQMAESLFGLGATIGGLPGQAKDQRKQQEFNQLMQQGQQAMASKDPVALSAIAQQLAAAGYQKEAQQLAQAAATAREKARLQGVLSGADLQTPEGLGALSQYFKEEGDAVQAIEIAGRQKDLFLGNET